MENRTSLQHAQLFPSSRRNTKIQNTEKIFSWKTGVPYFGKLERANLERVLKNILRLITISRYPMQTTTYAWIFFLLFFPDCINITNLYEVHLLNRNRGSDCFHKALNATYCLDARGSTMRIQIQKKIFLNNQGIFLLWKHSGN